MTKMTKKKTKKKTGRPRNCGKCKKPKTKCKCGRPKKITKKVVDKLEKAFSMGCNDTQACLYVDISRDTFYKYLKKNKKFSDRKEDLKQNPRLQARINVFNKLGVDPTGKFDMEFLKSTDEDFNPKKKVEVDDKREDETLEALNKLSEKFEKK